MITPVVVLMQGRDPAVICRPGPLQLCEETDSLATTSQSETNRSVRIQGALGVFLSGRRLAIFAPVNA